MKHPSRRIVLKHSGMVAVVASFGTSLPVLPARADELVSKDSVSYQTTPNNGSQCSQCKSFIAGATAGADGTCKVVAGPISPTGYCLAFSPV
ncbi:MAG: hypothetical protein P4L54_10270 [Acidocella sp.]|nr:hypothetical protein [Acidocella sp.]